MGIFLPALVGALILGVSIAVSDWDGNLIESLTVVFGSLILFFISGLVFVGIQSIIYSFVMEFMVNTFVKNNVIVVAISILLSLLSSLVFGKGFMLVLGGVVGLVVGVFLRVLYLTRLEKMLSIGINAVYII